MCNESEWLKKRKLFVDLLDPEDTTLEYAAIKAPHRQDFPVDAILVKNENGLTELLLSFQSKTFVLIFLIEFSCL